MWITGLRFVLRDGKKILQCRGIESLGFDSYEGRIGLGQIIDWQDVPLEEETYAPAPEPESIPY
jgi:hypothetical protein